MCSCEHGGGQSQNSWGLLFPYMARKGCSRNFVHRHAQSSEPRRYPCPGSDASRAVSMGHKKELLKIPLFGWALGSTGAISLDRSNREESVKRLQEGTSTLHGGWSVLIYPEGTRTSDGMIQNFKKGPFMMAVQAGIPILPVTCNGAFKILPKKTLAIRAGHIDITIGNPIPTDGKTEKDVPELMEKTRQEMISHFDPDYDPFQGKYAEDEPFHGPAGR